MAFDPTKASESMVSVWRAMTTTPRAAAFGAAAAVTAPLFLSNDERGYFKTATMTTPIIGAGVIAAPLFSQAYRSIGSKLINHKRTSKMVDGAGVPTYETMKDFTSEFEKGNVFLSQYEDMTRRFYGGAVREARDIPREQRAVISHLRTLWRDPTRRSLVKNAVWAESYRVMNASQLAKMGSRNVAPDMNLKGMFSYLRSNLGNENFIRGLSFRLNQARGLVDQGGALSKLGQAARDGFEVRSLGYNNEPAMEFLRRSKPGLADELQRAVASGKVKPEELRFATLRSNQGIHRIAGLEINRKHDKAFIHLVDPETNSIFMGDTFNRKGASRLVHDAVSDSILPADIYAVRHLDDLNHVKAVLDKAQFGGYLDRADDTFQHFQESDHMAFQLDELSQYARSQQVLIPGLDQMPVAKKEAFLMEVMKKHNLIKTWSEGSFAKGILETDVLGQASLGGVYNVDKQARALRGLKPIMASDAIDSVKISGFHAPFSRTNFWDRVVPSAVVPEFGTRIGSVDAGLKSLIGDLPKRKSLFDKSTRKMAAGHLMRDLGVPEQEAERIWGRMREWLYKDDNLSKVRKLGYLGEGDHLIIGKNMPNVLTPKTYYVHDVRLNDIESMITNKQTFGNDLLLGFFNGNAVNAGSNRNLITGYNILEDGRTALHVNEISDIRYSKLDTHTKGLAYGANEAQSAKIREFMNFYGEVSGTGIHIPKETEVLALSHYSHNKANAGEQTLNIGADMMRRLEGSGQMHEVASYKNALEGLGFSYENQTLIDSVDAFKSLDYSARSQRLQEAVDVINEMMEDVGHRISDKKLIIDEFMNSYSSKYGKLIDYVHRNASPVNAMAWNSVTQNVPGQAKITYDMMGHMYMRGQHGVLGDLIGRANIDGDINMTEELIRHADKADFSTPLGPVIGVEDLFKADDLSLGDNGNIRILNPNMADVRAGTMLDPANELAKKNWSLRLSDGRHLPILGHEAYGGKVNQYEAGKFSSNAREKLLHGIAEAELNGLSSQRDLLVEDYMKELSRFGHGKESLLRADRIDPLGISGFIQTRPSSMGGANPFEIGLSDQMITKIKDARIRKAILRGDEMYAAMARHPISHVPLMKVVRDNRLNPNIIGLDEGARGLMMADDDGDIASAFFFEKGTSGFEEARNAVHEANSLQHLERRKWAAFRGLEEDSRTAVETGLKSIADARVGLKEGQTVEKILRGRLAGGSIGFFSNTLTQLMLGLEGNTKITDSARRSELMSLFWEIRQAPIAAQKKAGDVGLEQALRMADRIRANATLATPKGSQGLYDALLDVSMNFGKSVAWHDDMKLLGLSEDMAIEGKINPFTKYLEKNKDLIFQFHTGQDKNVAAAAKALTASSEGIKYDRPLLDAVKGMVPYLGAKGGTSTGASISTSTLGAVNEGITQITREADSLFKGPAGKVLAAGLGISALAGLLSSDLPSMEGGQSSNKFRPEEAIGSSDHVPGEPVTGSMAPTSPPRTMRAGSPGVRTSVVAPMHQSVDLEVRAKAKDRGLAAEQAKLFARMSTDGDSNVTINYRGAKRQSLRQRQRMKDELNR
jgi:hypothetical protein